MDGFKDFIYDISDLILGFAKVSGCLIIHPSKAA